MLFCAPHHKTDKKGIYNTKNIKSASTLSRPRPLVTYSVENQNIRCARRGAGGLMRTPYTNSVGPPPPLCHAARAPNPILPGPNSAVKMSRCVWLGGLGSGGHPMSVPQRSNDAGNPQKRNEAKQKRHERQNRRGQPNSIAFGKSTSQRIYPKQHTPKIG